MMEITLIAVAITTIVIGSFLALCSLVWIDAGCAQKQAEFKPGNAMSCAVGRRLYRVIQYGLIIVATGAWGILGYQLVIV